MFSASVRRGSAKSQKKLGEQLQLWKPPHKTMPDRNGFTSKSSKMLQFASGTQLGSSIKESLQLNTRAPRTAQYQMSSQAPSEGRGRPRLKSENPLKPWKDEELHTT
ncbi:unnamed protein product [Pleuronectes platessa]|uniref:Uncharacterized protein n=1 Tax=Pleuronectes platessa TaxID=8262 RepID=A0A9N7VW84_PLEPL|nr:unnamed protein product [Pleuronectes platessa]